MSKRSLALSILTVTLATLVVAPKADAGLTSESFSHTTAQATVPFADMFTLATFDTRLGTLQSVTITLSSSVTTNLDIFSKGSYSFTNAFGTVPISVTGPDGSTISTSTTATVASGNLVAGDNFFSGITGSGSTSSTLTSNLSAYQSVGGVGANFNAAFNGATFGGTTTAPANSVFFGGGATAGGVTTITYNYLAAAATTPEPASIAMVVLGLGGIFGVSRFRRRAV